LRGPSPEVAVDEFVARLRRTLACVVRGTAIASGNAPDVTHSVTLFPEGRSGGDPARLRTHGGEGELLLRLALQFRVDRLAGVDEPYHVSTAFYHFDVLDRDGNEIVVFHWEPEGRGPVHAPHLHLSATTPVVLPQREGSGVAGMKTHLSRLHLPTGQLLIEDVVELLIRDFAVVPLRDDWEHVLADNREATTRAHETH
jgi:hypothetical protein